MFFPCFFDGDNVFFHSSYCIFSLVSDMFSIYGLKKSVHEKENTSVLLDHTSKLR